MVFKPERGTARVLKVGKSGQFKIALGEGAYTSFGGPPARRNACLVNGGKPFKIVGGQSLKVVVAYVALWLRVRITYARIMTLAAKVLTVSDSVAAGQRGDQSGPRLAARLQEAGYDVVDTRVVPDGIESVTDALRELTLDFAGLIITTGGTGFSPRDVTPEATLRVLDREAPGLSEAMRLVSPLGRLSRARAGTAGRCLILNTPGSPGGALESLEAVVDVLAHALELLHGGDGHHPPDTGGSTAISS